MGRDDHYRPIIVIDLKKYSSKVITYFNLNVF